MTVAFGYDASDFARLPKGFGFLVPKKERRRLVACTWVGTKFSHRVAPGKGADGRAAHAHDASAHRLPRKHRIEIDDTVHVGERHTQGAAHFCCNRFGEPAIQSLCGVQGGEERRAALGRQLGEERTQVSEIGIKHLISQPWV